MTNDIIVTNIREYLYGGNKILGEGQLKEVLSEFFCEKNSDVENFLKNNSIEFTKKNQSVTYLVFSNEHELLGYFTLAIKPIRICIDSFSRTINRKISRVSRFDSNTNSFTLSGYLIAQLGKNYSNELSEKISGSIILNAAINKIKELQYRAGGMVIFLETENKDKLLDFYVNKNGFRRFSTRESKTTNNHELIQLLKVIK